MLKKQKRALARFSIRLEHTMDLLEIILAVTIMIGFAVSFAPLILEIPRLASLETDTEAFTVFLEHAFNLVVGIEFIKMLTKHTPGSVLEVVMFTIARHLVLDHGTALEGLFSVATIGLIFLIRRFTYVHSFTSKHDEAQMDWLMEGVDDEPAKKKEEKHS